MTAIDNKMQIKKVPKHYRKRLRETEVDELTGLPKEPRKARIRPLTSSSLPLDRVTTMLVIAMDLDDDDKVALIANLQAKHNDTEAK